MKTYRFTYMKNFRSYTVLIDTYNIIEAVNKLISEHSDILNYEIIRIELIKSN